MKFTVSSSVLLKQLAAINGVVSTNPIVPILENFLFQLDNNQLTVTASDLQTVMVTELQVESSDKGAIAIPAKLLLDTLRGLPEQKPLALKLSLTMVATNSREKIQLTFRKSHRLIGRSR
jgi:DNA polymerase III subunit beta